MKYTLENIAGIPHIFMPMHDANSVTIEIMVKAGSIYETVKTNGISHFLEHMFFKGGKKYPTPIAVAQAVDSFGGEFNAYTSDEYAGYYVKCAPEFIIQAVDVLSDMLVNPQFPIDEMEREKGVVIQEIKMYEDNPARLVFDKRKRFFYGDNSFGRSTLGPVENIQSFTQEMLFQHKHDLYTKDNMVIVIAGRIQELETLQQKLAETFADLPTSKRMTIPTYPAVLPNEKDAVYQKKTEQNHMIISALGFDGRDDRRYAASVLATILGGNMSSRLFQNIREKQGLCYYIGGSHNAESDHGVFTFRAGMDKQRFPFGVEKIHAEIQRVADGDFTREEFENAIGYRIGQLQMGIE